LNLETAFEPPNTPMNADKTYFQTKKTTNLRLPDPDVDISLFSVN